MAQIHSSLGGPTSPTHLVLGGFQLLLRGCVIGPDDTYSLVVLKILCDSQICKNMFGSRKTNFQIKGYFLGENTLSDSFANKSFKKNLLNWGLASGILKIQLVITLKL